jgi:aspartyl-tRNA(Asn)/glutamyl-tRNA(Gln) amidotransferase subunit C
VNHLVTEEEIERVAKLMKIDVHDHKEYVEKVHEMIDYFDILDSAGVSDEEIKMKSLPLSSFREDKHIPFEEKLIDNLKNYKGTYVRAPKMV